MEILILVALILGGIAIVLGIVALYLVIALRSILDDLVIDLMLDDQDLSDVEMYEHEVFVN